MTALPAPAILTRRAVVAAALAAPLARPAFALPAPALPVPQDGRLAFRMLRNGSEIGLHTLEFAPDGAGLAVRVAIDIAVKFGPITMYRYAHRATETWRGGQFVALESQTDHDGSPQFARARREGDGIVVEGSKTERYVAPGSVLATTYWNKAMLGDSVINSEDGRLFRIAVSDRGEQKVPLASGATVPARHYELAGDLTLDLFYDQAATWTHLRFSKDGTPVIYEKL